MGSAKQWSLIILHIFNTCIWPRELGYFLSKRCSNLVPVLVPFSNNIWKRYLLVTKVGRIPKWVSTLNPLPHRPLLSNHTLWLAGSLSNRSQQFIHRKGEHEDPLGDLSVAVVMENITEATALLLPSQHPLTGTICCWVSNGVCQAGCKPWLSPAWPTVHSAWPFWTSPNLICSK